MRLVRRLTLLALLALMALGVAVAGSYLWVEYQFRAGRAALERRDLGAAAARLDRYLQTWPRSAPARLLRARAARLAGDFDEADRHLDECQKLTGPTDAVVLERSLVRAQRGELTPGLEQQLRGYVEQDHPESIAILEALGLGYAQAYRLHSALWCLNHWLERQHGHVPALLRRGWVHERLRDFDKARDDYRQVLVVEPTRAAARLRLAQVLLYTAGPGEAEEAAELFEQLHGERPEDAPVVLGLAQAWKTLRRVAEAERLLDAFLADHPAEAPLLLERGRLALDQGRPAEAEALLRRAAALDPHDYQVNYSLSLALRRQGKSAEAQEHLDRAERIKADLDRMSDLTLDLQARPYDPALHTEIGRIFLRSGQPREGVLWLIGALRVDPAYRPAHQALADHYEAAGQAELAATHRLVLGEQEALRRAQRGELTPEVEGQLRAMLAQAHPDVPVIFDVLTRQLMEKYRLPDAWRLLDAWHEREPGRIEPLVRRGWVAEHLFAFDQAAQDYEATLLLDRRRDPVRLRLAEILLQLRRPADALPHLKELIQRRPDDPAARLALARCRHQQGDTAEARRLLDDLVAQPDVSPAALVERGRVALADDEPARAEGLARRALVLTPHDREANYLLYRCLVRLSKGSEAQDCLARLDRIKSDESRMKELMQQVLARPHETALCCEIGEIFLRNDLNDDGVRWLQTALEEDPKYGPAHRALADHYERSGQKVLAEQHRRQAGP